jgi:hypothetical protein
MAAHTVLLWLISVCVSCVDCADPGAVSHTAVMYQGDRDQNNVSYAAFMVPGFVAVHGRLLTFAEG